MESVRRGRGFIVTIGMGGLGGIGIATSGVVCLALAMLLLLSGCAPAGNPAEHRCLQRTEAAYGYHARWVRCPAGSPVVLPDDY